MQSMSASLPTVCSGASQPGAPGPSQHVAVTPARRLQPTSEAVSWHMPEGHCMCVKATRDSLSLRPRPGVPAGVFKATGVVAVTGAAMAVAMAQASRTKAQRAACGGREAGRGTSAACIYQHLSFHADQEWHS